MRGAPEADAGLACAAASAPAGPAPARVPALAQAHGQGPRLLARFGELAQEQYREQMVAQRYLAVFFSCVEFLSGLSTVLILAVGVVRVGHGTLTTGQIVAFLLCAGLLFDPLQRASSLLDEYQRAAVATRRVQELLRTDASTAPPLAASGVPDDRTPEGVAEGVRGGLELDGLRYRYAGAATDALSVPRLTLAPGRTVAVVGETGAGKSTLLKVLAGLYVPTGGTLRVGGADLWRLDSRAYRRRIGFVPQEPCLLGATVREALVYGRPEASDAQVERAAREVGVHAVIRALPDGYGHRLSEQGRNLSLGQRQLVALARARLVAPDLLLLDEATASMDLAAEAVVGRGLVSGPGSPTTVVVAHRLTTARRADRILVMDRGRVAEDGTHEELLAARGRYAALWASYTGQGVAPGPSPVPGPRMR